MKPKAKKTTQSLISLDHATMIMKTLKDKYFSYQTYTLIPENLNPDYQAKSVST